jgi:hypothetical protein
MRVRIVLEPEAITERLRELEHPSDHRGNFRASYASNCLKRFVTSAPFNQFRKPFSIPVLPPSRGRDFLRTAPFKNVHKPAISARNLGDGFFPRHLLRPPAYAWIPEGGSAHGEADEA